MEKVIRIEDLDIVLQNSQKVLADLMVGMDNNDTNTVVYKDLRYEFITQLGKIGVIVGMIEYLVGIVELDEV